MCLELLLERAVRPVVVRPALLVLDDLTLVVEVLLAERIEQRRHPVGLEPEGELELVGGQRLEVVRPIQPGRSVHRAARGLDEGDVLRLRDVARTLEHDVLEQVGEARLARDLVLGPDVVPEVHRDDGSQVVLGDDDAQSVVEPLVAEGDLRDGDGHESPQGGVGGGQIGNSMKTAVMATAMIPQYAPIHRAAPRSAAVAATSLTRSVESVPTMLVMPR